MSHTPPAPSTSNALLLVGGVFDEHDGRPSGYFRKFSAAVKTLWPGNVEVVNGGSYLALSTVLNNVPDISSLFWFADIPNSFPKLLPELKQRFPHLTLVQSKNNRAPRQYTREQLLDRMQQSGAAFLLAFTLGDSGSVEASLLNREGELLFERVLDITTVARLTLLSVLSLPGATASWNIRDHASA